MGQAVIRVFPIYLNNKKIAEMTSNSYDINPGDEAQIGIDGLIGFSDGVTITKIDTDCIIPVKGMTTRIVDVMLKKQYCQVGIFADGKIHQIDCRVTHGNYSSDAKTGRAMGKFSFEGGAPDVTG